MEHRELADAPRAGDPPAMSHDLHAVTARLYEALDERNVLMILNLLAPSFVGIVSDGMPAGAGGRHEGADAMVRDCWGRVFALYDVEVRVDEILPAPPDRVVVTGRYVGVRRKSDRIVDAAFLHLLRIEGGRIAELRQVTDTARWDVPAA